MSGEPKPERPDLTKWRWRQALRSSGAAQKPINKSKYRRSQKHKKDEDKHE